MKVVKVDGNKTTTKLPKAKFQIFTDPEAKTPLTVKVDDKNVNVVAEKVLTVRLHLFSKAQHNIQV